MGGLSLVSSRLCFLSEIIIFIWLNVMALVLASFHFFARLSLMRR